MKPFTKCLRIGCLVVGCLATGLAFSSDAFSATSSTIKIIFGYSQTEVELIMSMAILGLVAAWPASISLRYFGPRCLSIAALALTSGGCSLVYTAVYFNSYFSKHVYLFASFYLLIGIGNGIMYIMATTVNLINFEGRWLSLVSGTLHSMKSVVLGILLLSFELIINDIGGMPRDKNAARLAMLRYTLVLDGMYAATNLLSLLLYGDYRDADASSASLERNTYILENKPGPSNSCSDHEETTMSDNLHGTKTYESVEPTSSQDEKSVSSQASGDVDGKDSNEGKSWWLLRQPYFHTIFWPSVLIMGLRNSFIDNVDVFLQTVGLRESQMIIYLIPVIGAVSKPLIGVGADALEGRLPRSLALIVSTIILLVFVLLDVGFLNYLPMLVGSMIMAQITSSCVQTLAPPIIIQLFGVDAIGTAWGLITVGFTLSGVLLQVVLGTFYDYMTPLENNNCSGVFCFLVYFVLNAVLVYLSCAALFFLTKHLQQLIRDGYRHT